MILTLFILLIVLNLISMNINKKKNENNNKNDNKNIKTIDNIKTKPIILNDLNDFNLNQNECQIKKFNIVNGTKYNNVSDNMPAFRGLNCDYNKKYYDQFGGSRPFQFKEINDLATNVVNYGVYGSYRIKKKLK